jgi:hypothetical protein
MDTSPQVQQQPPQIQEEKSPLQSTPIPDTTGHQYNKEKEFLGWSTRFVLFLLYSVVILYFSGLLEIYKIEVPRYFDNNGVEVYGVYTMKNRGPPYKLYSTDHKEYISWRSRECANKSPFQMSRVESGYLEVIGYTFGIKNISISDLSETMKQMCPIDSCKCVCSFHLGMSGNFVFVHDKPFMIDPIVTYQSLETFTVEITQPHINDEDGVSSSGNKDKQSSQQQQKKSLESVPVLIKVDYTTERGTRDKITASKTDAACVMGCMYLNKHV